jgi:hypothetical protein
MYIREHELINISSLWTAEQRKIEKEAKAERNVAKKDALVSALAGGRTLAGFDLEMTLRLNLLEILIKVK